MGFCGPYWDIGRQILFVDTYKTGVMFTQEKESHDAMMMGWLRVRFHLTIAQVQGPLESSPKVLF